MPTALVIGLIHFTAKPPLISVKGTSPVLGSRSCSMFDQVIFWLDQGLIQKRMIVQIHIVATKQWVKTLKIAIESIK